jgi:PGF-CTERM protein
MATIAEYSGTYYFKLWPNRPPENVNYTVTMFSVGEQGNGTASTTQRTATPAGPSSTSTPNTPTVTVSETNATVSYPTGYAASGITDSLRAASQHRSALSGSSSYTVTRNRSTILRTQTLHENTTLRINTTANRALTYENLSGGGNEPVVSETYHTDNAAYERTIALFEKAPMYSANPTRFSGFANRSFPSVEQFLLSANYGSAQPVVRNGETLIRYKATESTERPIFGFVSSENMNNATGLNATILVDQNGIVRSLSFSVTYRGEDGYLVTKQLDRQITSLNTTTVSKPSWLAEAKANTSIQTTVAPTERPTQTPSVTQTATTEPTTTTTMTPTITSPDSPTGKITTTDGTAPSGTTVGGTTTGGSGTSGPGFGPTVAVVALLTGALLAVRRRTE